MHDYITLFGIEIHALSMESAVETVYDWLERPRNGRCRFVVTPNVDHAVMLQHNERLSAAYRDADLVLADGFPLVIASRFLKKPLPQRVAGSELIPAFFARAQLRQAKPTVYLLGAMPGVADRAAERIVADWPNVDVVGTYSPPLGFEHDESQCRGILQKIADVKPDVLVVGLGAPKQELWVHKYQLDLQAKVAFCVGATIDFLAGEKSQAPVWMRKSGLEWIHRIASEPRRLALRYALDAWIFPQLLVREWRNSSYR